MSHELAKRAEAVFLEIVALPPGERPRRLMERCAGDEALRAEVASLLGPMENAPSFLSTRHLRAVNALESGATLPPNVRIADYTLLGVLGTGGMGVVYIAEQERPRRTVALKLMRALVHGSSPQRRFEHEAELLGRLQHPGIAQIFEAGIADTGTGPTPFIAMELVRGKPLSEYAEDHKLGTHQRLALMAKICDAVEHAHRKGIIHRDLKPGNILVDESGQPKVLDFGVARATDADLAVTTVHTGVGQLIGTLPYMSPEQVGGDPTDIDTRSDVYSLGVVLFQLLAGRLPHDLSDRPVPEAARVIRDEAPRRLSTISKVFRGDVDVIVSKALEKNKERRYQSAAALGGDIARYLAGEAIEAKRDSTMYVLRKQLRRYRGAAAAACVFVIGLSLFSVYAWSQARSNRALADKEALARTSAETSLIVAQRDRAIALREKDRADEAAESLLVELSQSNIERGRLQGVNGNVALAEDFLWTEFFRHPERQQPRWALWELYSRYPCVWSTATESRTGALGACGPEASVVAVTSSQSITLYDAADGAPLANYPGVPGVRASVVTLTHDEQTVIGGYRDGKVRLWTRDPMEPPRVLGGGAVAHSGGVLAVALSPDDSVLATGGADNQVRLWSMTNLTELARGEGHTGLVLCLAFSPDGQRLASGGRDNAVRTWRLPGLVPENTLTGHTDQVNSLAFTPDGTSLFSGSHDRTVMRWAMSGGKGKTLDSLFLNSVRGVDVFSNGRAVAAAGGSIIRVWTRPFDSMAPSVAGGDDGAFHGLVGTRFGTLVSLSGSGRLRGWEAKRMPAMRGLGGHASWVFSAEYSPDNTRIATGSGDGTVGIWDAATRKRLFSAATGTNLRTRMVRFTPDGSRLLAASADGLVRVIDPANGTVVTTLGNEGPEMYSLAVSPDGSVLAAGSSDGQIQFWNLRSLERLGEMIGRRAAVENLAYSTDGTTLFSSGVRTGLEVIDAASRTVRDVLPTDGDVWGVAVSPDGTRLAASTNSGSIELWELPTLRKLGTLAGHTTLVAGLAFSPDSSLLASGGDDATVRLWDGRTGEFMASMDTHHGEAPGLAFSRDGRWLAAGCQAQFCCLWDLWYLDRNIAANLEFHAARLSGQLGNPDMTRARAWAESVRARQDAAAE